MRPVKLMLIAVVAVIAVVGIAAAIVSWQSSIQADRIFSTPSQTFESGSQLESGSNESPDLPSTMMPDQSSGIGDFTPPAEDTSGMGQEQPLEDFNEPSPSGAGQNADIIYEVYTDRSQNAFDILIPQGWTASSTVGINAAGGLNSAFTAQSPDGLSSIGFQKPRSPTYQIPSGSFTQEGMTSHGGNVAYYYYRTPDQYVNDILLPELRATVASDTQVTAATPLLSQATFQSSLYEFVYTRGGIEIVTQIIVTTYGDASLTGQLLIWFADLNAVTAPRDQIDTFAETGWNAIGSVTIKPDFIREYLGGSGGVSSGPGTPSTDAFFDALHSIQQSQSGLDRTFQGFSDATLGVRQAVDPLGNTYTVSESHTWWYRGVNSGLLYGSDSGQPSAPEDLVPLQ